MNAPFSQDHILTRERRRLDKLLTNGLDPVYDDWEDYWYDFFPDFSWTFDCIRELQWLLDDPQWQDLAAQLKASRGVDFPAMLAKAIKTEKAFFEEA
jgi:hypothetical protein